VDPHERTEVPRVCLDSDVVIAGLFSKQGASHALLVLAEMGLVAVVLPLAGIDEVKRNLQEKLPEALPLFEKLLDAEWVDVHRPAPSAMEVALAYAHPKDAPIFAAALSSSASILVTHNTRHFQEIEAVRVMKPGDLLVEIRAWMVRFGPGTSREDDMDG